MNHCNLGIYFLIFVSSICAHGAETLEQHIGVVRVALQNISVANNTGPAKAIIMAKELNDAIVVSGKRPDSTILPKFALNTDTGFDMVGYQYQSAGVNIQIRYTSCGFGLTLSNQDVVGKTNAELTTIINDLAKVYFKDFSTRNLKFDVNIDANTNVFVIDLGPTGKIPVDWDWSDTVTCVVQGTNVCFTCVTKLKGFPQSHFTLDEAQNKSWFAKLDSQK